MQEIRLKRITLFLLESILLRNERMVDIGFAAQFNYFIEKYYQVLKETI